MTMTQIIKSSVVRDSIDTIGTLPLLIQIYRMYAKELE